MLLKVIQIWVLNQLTFKSIFKKKKYFVKKIYVNENVLYFEKIHKIWKKFHKNWSILLWKEKCFMHDTNSIIVELC